MTIGMSHEAGPEHWLALRRPAACFRALRQVLELCSGRLRPTLGYPLNPDATLNPSQTVDFPRYRYRAVLSQRHQGSGVNGFPRGNVQNHYYTFQPRVGWSWNVFENGRTVFRGDGLFWERVQGNDVSQRRLEPPFATFPPPRTFTPQPQYQRLDWRNDAEPLPVEPDEHSGTTTTLPGRNYSLGIRREFKPSIIAVVSMWVPRFQPEQRPRINTLPLTRFGHPADPINNPLSGRKQVATGKANANLYRFSGPLKITQEENETNFNKLAAGRLPHVRESHGSRRRSPTPGRTHGECRGQPLELNLQVPYAQTRASSS